MDSFVPFLVTLLLLGILVGLSYYLLQLIKFRLKRHDPYEEHRLPDNLFIRQEFAENTLAGFKLRYRLSLYYRRANSAEFAQAQMLNTSARQAVAFRYNDNAFLSYLRDNDCFFHLEWISIPNEGKMYEVIRLGIYQIYQEDGEYKVREMRDHLLKDKVMSERPYRDSGCDIELSEIERNIFPRELIEENYRMLSEKVKETILNDPHYGTYQEMLAVMALKQRQEILGDRRGTHRGIHFEVGTETVGRGTKLAWRLYSSAPTGYEIRGFRKTGGFHPELYDGSQNGLLVVHSQRDGETVELLEDGQSYFYTFYLQSTSKNRKGEFWVNSPVRFQIAIPTRDELEAIESMLKRFEELKAKKENDNISQALKDVGLYLELDNALETTENKRVAEIEASDATEEEKKRKISRLREVVGEARDRYGL